MAGALDGVRRVFLVSGPSPEMPTVEAAAVEAFRAANVEYVVKSSILGADPDAIPFRSLQAAAEEALRASGLPHAVLRPHYFTQNLLGSAEVIRTKGVHEDAACGAPLSMVDLRDVGACAAALLTGDVRDGETFDLTGPAAVTGAQVAEVVSGVTGAEVTAVDLPPAELGARLAGWGLPEWFAGALVALYEDYAASGATGYAARVSTAVRELTGHPARSVADFVADHVEAFRPGQG
jgi:uncharacterized protein YbjT (DUF2867 family)